MQKIPVQYWVGLELKPFQNKDHSNEDFLPQLPHHPTLGQTKSMAIQNWIKT